MAHRAIEMRASNNPPSSKHDDDEENENAPLVKQESAIGFSNYLVSVSGDGLQRKRHVVAHYEKQNALIQDLLEAEAVHRGEFVSDEGKEEEDARTQRALNLSFASNFVLLIIRLLVAILSGSLSMMVTTLDAVLDVISGSIIWFTERLSKQRDKYKYPVGKGRMAPLGVIVFSSIMGTAGMSIIMEGVTQIVGHHETNEAMAPMEYIIGAALLVIAMKGGMWLMCRSSPNASVQAFALDHLNDVVVNATGLVGILLGEYVVWWLDPGVAIAMSVWLIWAWGGAAYEQLMSLVGMSAPPELLQKLTYVAFQHAPSDILGIDTVRAHSFGCEQWLVEVDVVLHGDMPLSKAHDVGEELQLKLEKLPEVARAYVHLDYETNHGPEVEHKEL